MPGLLEMQFSAGKYFQLYFFAYRFASLGKFYFAIRIRWCFPTFVNGFLSYQINAHQAILWFFGRIWLPISKLYVKEQIGRLKMSSLSERVRGFIKASSNLYQGFFKASSRLHQGFIKTSSRLHQDFVKASSSLHQGFVKASSRLR